MMTKKQAATLLFLMMVALTGLGNAQTSTIIKAKVPFEFVENGKTMPAGECIVAVVVSNGRTVLSIGSGNQHVYEFSDLDESMNASGRTVLVFHQYGDRYFLAGIKRDGKTGYHLPMSRLESELQARNAPEQAITLLASAK